MSVEVISVKDLDWDGWRIAYDRMTLADQKAYYERVARECPCQESFNLASAHAAFDKIGGGANVIEMGGWNGKLAGAMLARGDVRSWINHDLVEVPQATADPRYSLIVLDDWLWNFPQIRAEVFVATHAIEHVKARELELLFSKLRVDWIYLEAPIPEDSENTDWTGYPGTHVLEVGWRQIDDTLRARGFENAGGRLWGR